MQRKYGKRYFKNICSLAEQSKVEPPAIIVVGEAVGLDFSATIEKPLKNKTVAVTGTHKLSAKLGRELMSLGARINRIDYLSVKEYRQNEQLDKALSNVNNYNYIVLTSMNGAEIFIKKLRELKVDVRKLCNVKFAVIGSGTAGILENTAFCRYYSKGLYFCGFGKSFGRYGKQK